MSLLTMLVSEPIASGVEGRGIAAAKNGLCVHLLVVLPV